MNHVIVTTSAVSNCEVPRYYSGIFSRCYIGIVRPIIFWVYPGHHINNVGHLGFTDGRVRVPTYYPIYPYIFHYYKQGFIEAVWSSGTVYFTDHFFPKIRD